jgi:hypothetical protein
MLYRNTIFCAIFVLGTQSIGTSAQALDAQQVGLIKDTAVSICNTVKDVKGEKTDVQIQGEIKGQLSGLLGRLASAGASTTGSLSRTEFEGLTQDATGIALTGDRDCRERIFDKIFAAILSAGTSVKAGDCGIANTGTATGNSINCGPPPAAPSPKP